MEEIIKLQIKTIEIKLTIASEGKKKMLEAKLVELKKMLGGVKPIAKKVDSKPRHVIKPILKPISKKPKEEVKEELPKAIIKEIKKKMLEVKPKEVVASKVEKPKVDLIGKEIDKEIIKKISDLGKDVKETSKPNVGDVVKAIKKVDKIVIEEVIKPIVVEELPTVKEIESEIEKEENKNASIKVEEPKKEVKVKKIVGKKTVSATPKKKRGRPTKKPTDLKDALKINPFG